MAVEDSMILPPVPSQDDYTSDPQVVCRKAIK